MIKKITLNYNIKVKWTLITKQIKKYWKILSKVSLDFQIKTR